MDPVVRKRFGGIDIEAASVLVAAESMGDITLMMRSRALSNLFYIRLFSRSITAYMICLVTSLGALALLIKSRQCYL
jgi:hypothetical protein